MPQYWMISDRNNGGIGADPNVAGIIMATVRRDHSAQVKAQLATESAAKSTEVRNKIIVVRAAHAEGDAQEANQAIDAVECLLSSRDTGLTHQQENYG